MGRKGKAGERGRESRGRDRREERKGEGRKGEEGGRVASWLLGDGRP